MNNVMKISKGLNTFAGIARSLTKAVAVIIAVCVVILMFVTKHNAIWQNVDYTLQLGNVTLELIPDGAISPEATRLLIIVYLIFNIPYLLLLAKCLHIIQDILTPMSQGKPFDSSVSNSLRKLCFIALIVGAIAEAGDMALSALQLYNVNLDTLFNPQFVSGYTVEQTLDMNFLLIFGVLFLMSHIFRYGEELQQLSDETL